LTQVPQFSDTDEPGKVVAEAGEWLASELSDGFKYLRSKREITRKAAGRSETIILQTSSWSRTAEGTWVTPRITVSDDRVRKWQAERRLVGMFATGGFIFNSMVVNLGLPDLELFGPLHERPDGHHISLVQFRDSVFADIMPNLKVLRSSPAVAAERLPDPWIVFPEPPFWWATAYGDQDAAKRFLARYFESKPAGRRHFETGRRLAESSSEPEGVNNTLVAFGWSAVHSGALEATEPI
jgi:hypothetical protein